jgi:hypothetical protein
MVLHLSVAGWAGLCFWSPVLAAGLQRGSPARSLSAGTWVGSQRLLQPGPVIAGRGWSITRLPRVGPPGIQEANGICVAAWPMAGVVGAVAAPAAGASRG